MLGTPLALLLNPVMWATTILYVVSRLEPLTTVSTFIGALFPATVYYTGMMLMLVGNGALLYQNLVTPLVRQQQSESAGDSPGQLALARYLHQQEYGLTFRLLFMPLWWAFTSLSAYRAARRLLSPAQRSAWDQTPHGHALATEAEIEAAAAPVPSPTLARQDQLP